MHQRGVKRGATRREPSSAQMMVIAASGQNVDLEIPLTCAKIEEMKSKRIS